MSSSRAARPFSWLHCDCHVQALIAEYDTSMSPPGVGKTPFAPIRRLGAKFKPIVSTSTGYYQATEARHRWPESVSTAGSLVTSPPNLVLCSASFGLNKQNVRRSASRGRFLSLLSVAAGVLVRERMTMRRELFAAAGSAASGSGQLAGSACTRATRNTLSTQCYSACDQQYPLCVNYAALPANAADREGDGNYYYQGCPTNMTTCHSAVGDAQCQLQCLQSKNTVNTEWILDVAPPQTDRLETSLFVQVEKLSLPKTLVHMKLVGTTEHTRKVPITFEKDTFQSGTGLQKITLMDLGIGNISMNIFPANLSTLIMQRTLLTEFEPVGGEKLNNLRVLDLSENYLTAIPKSVFTFPNLTELRLEGNNMTNVELTSAELAFLRGLTTVGLTIEPPKSCAPGYTLYTWDSNTICYKDVGATDSSMSDNFPQSDSGPTSSTTTKSSKIGIIIASLVAAVVLAILVGIFFLKRAKKRKNEARKSLMAEEKPKSKIAAGMRAMISSKPNELADPLRDGSGELTPTRKATFREIPAAEVRVIDVVAETSIVTVSLGEYNKKKVLVNRLRVSDDPAENCETALGVTPVVAQLRHPQLLLVLGFMWEDVHTMSAICEHMNRGTLEDYLLASSTSLTWRNFKLKAAMDIAGCLMYLHGQTHKLTYDALSGRTVFVDSEKGCKLSTMIACLPNGLVKSHLAKSTRGFCAPEVMAGDESTPSSDMYAFGVLLAQLDTCETADEMIRSSLRQRSARDMTSFTDSNGPSTSLPEDFTASSGSRGSRALSGSSGSSSSLLSMFSFTNDCPDVVKELAFSCLQIDPSSRPSAQYVTAMLQHSM